MKNTVLIALFLLPLVSVSGCISPTGRVSERAALEDEILESLLNESFGNEIEEISHEIESMPLLNETEDESTPQEPKDPCADVSCPKIERTCPDGYKAQCQTECNQETGTCKFCTPDCSEHIAEDTICEESWECGEWSECLESQQTRTCHDANSCADDERTETRACEEPEELVFNITITEVFFDAPEWVEIKNSGNIPADLTNWTLQDAAQLRPHIFTFPELVLEVGNSVKIHTENGTDTTTDLYWGKKTSVWNNDGDTATLKNTKGETISEYNY